MKKVLPIFLFSLICSSNVLAWNNYPQTDIFWDEINIWENTYNHVVESPFEIREASITVQNYLS